MALEDVALLIPCLLSFLPAFVGSKLDNEDRWQSILAWALYALSFLLGMFSIQITSLALTRLFGGAPTAVEQDILDLLVMFNYPIQVYFLLFGLLLCLAITVWFVRFIASKGAGKTPNR